MGIKRACQAEGADAQQFCQASSCSHITLHADVDQSTSTDTVKKNQSVGGKPSSPEAAATEASKRTCEFKGNVMLPLISINQI